MSCLFLPGPFMCRIISGFLQPVNHRLEVRASLNIPVNKPERYTASNTAFKRTARDSQQIIKHRSFIPEHWAATCRCFRVNIDWNAVPPAPPAGLLNGSLPPGNGCRIRCFSELLNAVKVTRITAAGREPVWVQVSGGSTGIFSPGLVESRFGFSAEGDVLWLNGQFPSWRQVDSPRPGRAHTPTLHVELHTRLHDNFSSF